MRYEPPLVGIPNYGTGFTREEEERVKSRWRELNSQIEEVDRLLISPNGQEGYLRQRRAELERTRDKIYGYMAERNTPLLITIAKKYAKSQGMNLDELLSMGLETLHDCLIEWPPGSKERFCSYFGRSLIRRFFDESIRAGKERRMKAGLMDLRRDRDHYDPLPDDLPEFINRALKECFRNGQEERAQLLRLRYGIGGNGGLTLEEIGRIKGYTRKRASQTVGRAERQLRGYLESNHPHITAHLVD